MILSFLGYRHEVMQLMQILSHGTRAFIVNANVLPGFLVVRDLVEFLKDKDSKKLLQYTKIWQDFDLIEVGEKLGGFSKEQKKITFRRLYPALYLYTLKYHNKEKEYKKFISQCKTYEKDPKNYYLYVHGFFIPSQIKQLPDRRNSYRINVISQGKCSSVIQSFLCQMRAEYRLTCRVASVNTWDKSTKSKGHAAQARQSLKDLARILSSLEHGQMV